MTPRPSEPFLLSTAIYRADHVAAAADAYRRFCAVRASEASDGEICVTVAVAPEHASDAQRIVDEFLNCALDLSLQSRLGIGAGGDPEL